MNEYLITYKRADSDNEYTCTKWAKNESQAFQFAFGKKPNRDNVLSYYGVRIDIVSIKLI